MCGGSTFKAARSASSKFEKSDETGMVMSPCRHGVVYNAINMHRGETYIHTLFMHIFAMLCNARFFCNDVICRYSKFVKKVALAFPEYEGLKKMGQFLPRMHAKAHQMSCQVTFHEPVCPDLLYFLFKSLFSKSTLTIVTFLVIGTIQPSLARRGGSHYGRRT